MPAIFLWLPKAHRKVRAVDHSPKAWPLTLAAGIGFGTASTTTIGAWYVTTLVQAHSSPGAAGLLFAAGSTLGLCARLIVGVGADKRPTDELASVAKMQIGGAVACLVFATGHLPSLIVATPLAFMAGWGWTGLFNLAVVRGYPHAPGTATGVTQAGNYVGHVVGNLSFGFVADHMSLGTAWLVSSAFALVGAMFILVARQRMALARGSSDRVPGTDGTDASRSKL
jgi:predicted MFS family arabinose efflux permease